MDAIQTLIDKLTKEREQYEGLKVGTEDWELAVPFMAALETRLAQQERLKAQLQLLGAFAGVESSSWGEFLMGVCLHPFKDFHISLSYP